MRDSRRVCSSRVSVSLEVETRCWASTTRQHSPSAAPASDNSAAGVQVLDDIGKTGDSLNHLDGRIVECGVVASDPPSRDFIVPTGDCIERAIETHEKDCQLERLLSSLKRVAPPL